MMASWCGRPRFVLWTAAFMTLLSSSPSKAWMLPRDAGTLNLFSPSLRGSVSKDRCPLSIGACKMDREDTNGPMGLVMTQGRARLTISVEHVMDTAMPGSCNRRQCQQSFGAVSCAWNEDMKKEEEDEEPLAKTRHLCGVVEHVEGASDFNIGDIVIAPAEHGTSKGTKVGVSESMAVLKPASFSHEQACLLPPLSLLFLQAMKNAKVNELDELRGQKVLVTGGTSPVGSLAIQILAAVGAHVSATVSGSSQEKVLRELGASTLVDYKQHAFFEELPDLQLVVDALGSGYGPEAMGLKANGVRYGPLMHPVVSLVVEDGILFGGLKAKKFSGSSESVCEWTPSEAGMAGVGKVAAVLHERGQAPHFSKDAFTPSEWMEAVGWPKDVDTGGRFGFPGRSLWVGDESSEESRADERIDFTKYDAESEEAQETSGLVAVQSDSHLQDLLSERSPGQLTLIEFHSPFCRACRGMRPRFLKLPKKFPHNQFLSIDVKAQKELATDLGVEDIPAYVLYDGGKRKAKWTGVFRADELEFFAEGGGIG